MGLGDPSRDAAQDGLGAGAVGGGLAAGSGTQACFHSLSQVVVPYPFAGLVLLGAVSPEGAPLAPAPRTLLALRLGVMAAPAVVGTVAELARRLLPNTDADDARQADAPPAFEGWILSHPDGSNHKLVATAYKLAKRAGLFLHPLAAWDRVRRGGQARAALLRPGLPAHWRAELEACLDALQESYAGVRREVEMALREVEGDGSVGGGRHGRGPGPDPGPIGSHDDRELRLALALSRLNLGPPQGSGRPGADSGPTSSDSDADSAGGPLSLEYRAALRLALWSRYPGPPSMYLAASSVRQRGPGALMRGLLLDCIRPRRDGALPGYAPSANMALTLAKGWADGPRAGPLAGPEPAMRATLESGLVALVLGGLEGRGMARALFVCKEWYAIIAAEPEFAAKVERLVKAELEEAEEVRRRRREAEAAEARMRRFATTRNFTSYYGAAYDSDDNTNSFDNDYDDRRYHGW